MSTITKFSPLVAAVTLSFSIPALASADTMGESPAPATTSTALYTDVEIDPTAFLLDGYSLHAGIGWERLRLDLGAFAIAVPELFHGNEGFTSSFDGFGAKLQYFLFAEQTGAFVGVNTSVNRVLIQRDGTDLASRHNQYGVGGHIGWRFDLIENFYATPWFGIDYAFSARDITLATETYENTSWIFFPAIHLGRRFR